MNPIEQMVLEPKQKFCNNCKYLIGTRYRPESSFEWKCGAPANKEREFIDLLTGETKVIYKTPLCKEQREADYRDKCGIEGRWFEEYIPPQLLEGDIKLPSGGILRKVRVTEDDLKNL